MTTTLTACVLVPDLLLHLAAQHAAVHPPCAVVDDTSLARVRQCCRHATAAGVTPGMPAFLAKQHCPQLTITPLAASLINTTRATIATVLRQQGDHVHEVANTGWALRLLALGPQYGHAPAVAAEIAHAIRAATGLDPVLALAPTATTARIAAQDAAAHDGYTMPTVILPGTEAAFLVPRAVAHVPGVGTQTAARLAQFGITTIGAFTALPTATVVQLIGPRGRTLQAAARGVDVSSTPAATDTPWESTWHYAPVACADAATLVRHVQRLTERVGRRLRSAALTAGTITVGGQWADGRTQQRTERLPMAADLDQELARASHAALAALLATRRLAVRALTVRLGALAPRQASMFDHDPRLVERQRALDAIKRRHGTDAIVWASLIPSPPL